MAKIVTQKDFKMCYHKESGKTKSMAPAFYHNKSMMARLGWELLPEAEAPKHQDNEPAKQVRDVREQAPKAPAPPEVKSTTTELPTAPPPELPKEPQPAKTAPAKKPAAKKSPAKRQPQKQA